jgi:hypothetical protein
MLNLLRTASHLGSWAGNSNHKGLVAGHRDTVAVCRINLHHRTLQRYPKNSLHPTSPQRHLLQSSAGIARNTRSAKPQTTGTTYDIDFWHYQPWWWQPRVIVTTGIAIVASVSILAEDHMAMALWAAVPVGLWWHVFLKILPSQFRSTAVHYLETHDMDDAL